MRINSICVFVIGFVGIFTPHGVDAKVDKKCLTDTVPMNKPRQSFPRSITGQVVDYVTNRTVDDRANVSLLYPDSSVATRGLSWRFTEKGKPEFWIPELQKPGSYIVCISHPDYYPFMAPVEIVFRHREHTIDLGRFRLRRKLPTDQNILLDEVKIYPTKVKFYFDDDTLVYDAAAFTTQQGFVLNDILHKMPGIEIKSNGDIYAGGRKVSALLLNGKDFFDRDRQTILENLPAFMVKDVKFYDKKKDSLSVVRREREFSGYVMDVKLKKDYQTVGLANVELGAGTDGRYKGKLFALSVNQWQRFSTYAQLDNVNEEMTLGQDGNLQPSTPSHGEHTVGKIGLAYNKDHTKGLYAVRGGLGIRYAEDYLHQQSLGRRYVPSGDLYTRSVNGNKSYAFKVATNHNLSLFDNSGMNFTLRPRFSYERMRSNAYDITATFSTNVDSLLDKSWAHELQNNGLKQIIDLYGLNHYRYLQKGTRYALQTGADVEKNIDIPHTNDRITVLLSGNYDEQSNKPFSQRELSFTHNADESSLWNYQYQRMKTKKWEELFKVGYLFVPALGHALQFNYSFRHAVTDDSRSLFALHRLSGWDLPGKGIGLLPSETDLHRVLDASNSYVYTLRTNEHIASLKYSYSWGMQSKQTTLTFDMPMRFLKRQINFKQTNKDTIVRKKLTAPDFHIELMRQHFVPNRAGYMYSIAYKRNNEMTSLYNLVNFTDNSNPLLIVHGNSHLKNLAANVVYGQFLYQTPKFDIHRMNFAFTSIENQVSAALDYNPTTGVTDMTHRNVNGNRMFTITFANEVGLCHNRSWKGTNELSGTWDRNVDYVSSTIQSNSIRNVVHKFQLKEELGLSYQSTDTKLGLSATAYCLYSHVSRIWGTASALNTYDYGIRINSQIELPWNLRIMTDFRTVNRRGYDNHELNTDLFLWNVSASKAFGERFQLKLDAVDLLNQQQRFVFYQNAQGRTETFYNGLHRYVMLHAVFKLNTPKRNTNSF